mmetsp:Transcript_17756/g.54628  ORF Transcript_17756/g.54628 Transcript_17756/m.54628 type:complete len:228 (-) Transcript_17756:1419-2102(-)
MMPVVVRSSGAPTVRGAGGALGSAESGPPIQSGWSMNPVVLSSFKSPIMYPLRRPMSTPENPRRFGSPASNSRTTGTSPCCLSGGTRSAASDARPTLASASLVSFDGLGAKNQSLSPTSRTPALGFGATRAHSVGPSASSSTSTFATASRPPETSRARNAAILAASSSSPSDARRRSDRARRRAAGLKAAASNCTLASAASTVRRIVCSNYSGQTGAKSARPAAPRP